MEQAASAMNLIWVAGWLTISIVGVAYKLFLLMKQSISELKTEIGELRNEVSGLGEDISSLRERTASLEARVSILTTIALPPEIKKE